MSPWKDLARTRRAATVANQRKRAQAKARGLCWRCLPKRETPAVTICEGCRYRLMLQRCGVSGVSGVSR
jgi:hypothetical protein